MFPQTGTGNNFGELLPASLSGCVYWDVNHNGKMDSPDFGIAGVTITLTGTDSLGTTIHEVTKTADDGTYSFSRLRPAFTPSPKRTPGLPRLQGHHRDAGEEHQQTTGSRRSSSSPVTMARITASASSRRRGAVYEYLAVYVGNLFYISSERTRATRSHSPSNIRTSRPALPRVRSPGGKLPSRALR